MEIHPRVAWQLVGDEAVLIDLDRGRALGLNATGSFLWPRLGRRSESELAEDLAAAFDVELESARRDVTLFLVDMRRRGLLAG